MSQQQLNSLVFGRAAGKSFGVPEQDLGRLGVIAYTIGNPVLAIAAARSMARDATDPEQPCPPAQKNGAIESAQSAADYAEDAKDAAEKSEKAAGGSQQQAESAALDARNAADVAQKAAAAAQQAASAAQKAVEALNAATAASASAAKPGVLVQQGTRK